MKIRSAYSDRERVQFKSDKPSMTKQSFKNECDINSIMRKWKVTGVLPHARDVAGQYGDFSDIMDYQTALNAVISANDNFMSLPAKLRARFYNDPAQFLKFCDDPANAGELIALGLAQDARTEQNEQKGSKHTSEKKSTLSVDSSEDVAE